MRAYWNNQIADATVLIASSSKIGYNVDVLKNIHRARVFDFDDTDCTCKIDLQEVKPVDYCIIDVGSLPLDASVKVEANDIDDWTSPPFEATMNYSATSFFAEFETQTYRWWRLVISSSSNVRIGTLHLGFAPLQLPGIRENSQLFFNATNTNDLSISGQIYSSPGYEFLDTTFIFSRINESPTTIGDIEIASRYEIQQFWSSCRNIKPYWIFLWENNLTEWPPLYVINNQNSLNFEKILGRSEYQFEIRLREVI